ncbi:MAG: F0F1 ATP synthase subunit A [Candidatus Marinimicrobia bacterium]|nr:ATP synthase F0 subunit A [Candidatus Neomarinimicrobiota bacterium]MCS5647103.1 F0F1 ATP synthase subunit A [Candidatus Neomarinimicrobiota bacterium]MEC7736216.1 F0F1 ATP synthase subunit A [Candidatus Neomarinimicrobiota bacterium]|tara:strand:+ start:5981 stop:6910 length:930 start_codon:yes stop_codon:yes gene_type:complete
MSAVEAGHTSNSVMEQVGPNIIHHVSNSDISHPIIHLPTLYGINFSVTKHVFMLWLVTILIGIAVIIPVRRFLAGGRPVPTGWMNALETIVQFIRDSIVKPNVGPKWVMTWTPLVLTFFFFILFANGIGMIPIFDVLGAFNRFLLGVPASDSHNVVNGILHGGVTVTGNFNVTAGLATITFFSIIIAGALAHGFINHWKNLVPHGLAWPVYIILIPIEIMGLFVKPFALTMRLAANMTGGHIALLALLSLMAIFGEMFHSTAAGLGVAFVAIPIAVAISALEIIVVLVQAYVFTLLTAVFVGMAINVHH